MSAGKPLGLLGQMAGDPVIKPLLDLGGQMKNFDSHGEVLVHCLGDRRCGSRVDAPSFGVTGNIGCLTDRFQYLSFNNP
jgi:hypothetical protein